MTKYTNKELALKLLQISFGINYLFHGLVRMPSLKAFVESMLHTFENTYLPESIVFPFAYLIPFIEVLLGSLLIMNKYTKTVIVLTFVFMNILVIGSCIAQKWDAVGIQTIYIGFLFLLLFHFNEK
jgi:thiosulfate dehydrogenase [quinone] large subunit